MSRRNPEMYATTPMSGLMQKEHPKCVEFTKETKNPIESPL